MRFFLSFGDLLRDGEAIDCQNTHHMHHVCWPNDGDNEAIGMPQLNGVWCWLFPTNLLF